MQIVFLAFLRDSPDNLRGAYNSLGWRSESSRSVRQHRVRGQNSRVGNLARKPSLFFSWCSRTALPSTTISELLKQGPLARRIYPAIKWKFDV